jgi:hypothetical protein
MDAAALNDAAIFVSLKQAVMQRDRDNYQHPT